MTGPEHYAEAERLIAAHKEMGEGLQREFTPEMSIAQFDAMSGLVNSLVELAQVHATLALVAATAESGRTISPHRADECAQATQ